MTLVRRSLTIAAKDLRIELRGRHATAAVLPFAATMLVVFGLALGPGRDLLRETAPGLLWVAVLFSSVLSFRQAYLAETEDGALEGLVLSPVDRAAVFLGKGAAVLAGLLALEAVALVLVVALFDLPLGAPAVLAAAFALGTIGLSAVGSLFGALAQSARAREAVIPVLVLPLAVPVLLAGVRATALASAGRGGEAASWLGLLAAFDVVFVVLGILVFEHLLED
ncbi:MAG TPA: heme exporter protein CcmB [Actinomycetota bacterium]